MIIVVDAEFGDLFRVQRRLIGAERDVLEEFGAAATMLGQVQVDYSGPIGVWIDMHVIPAFSVVAGQRYPTITMRLGGAADNRFVDQPGDQLVQVRYQQSLPRITAWEVSRPLRFRKVEVKCLFADFHWLGVEIVHDNQ